MTKRQLYHEILIKKYLCKKNRVNLTDRIRSFEKLGCILREYREEPAGDDGLPLRQAATRAASENPWFTPGNIRIALNNLGDALSPGNLDSWLEPYRERLEKKTVQPAIGVVAAGNIPAAGFHDMLCVMLSGSRLIMKLSSADAHLLPAMARILDEDSAGWRGLVSFTSGTLKEFDAIIATGSTNTSRYFEYYFRNIPHLIRRNRNGVALLSGEERHGDLMGIADDIMLFFGLGCRNVSKIYVPAGYDFGILIDALRSYAGFASHHKYHNNYEYNRSVFLVNGTPFIDTGFLLLKEDRVIASPVGVLHYEFYDDPLAVCRFLTGKQEEIQCVIGSMDLPLNRVNPGQSQKPAPGDYADGTDTIEFLLSLPDNKISL